MILKNTRFLIFPLVFALSGCNSGSAEAPAAGDHAGPPPASVLLKTVATADVPVSYEYVGQVGGSREVEIRARVTGIIEKRLYEEGAEVKVGAPLFTIERAPYEVKLAQAEASLTSAEAQLKKAEREYQRIKPLLQRNLVSANQVDDADSARDVARAELKAAQAEVKSARIDLAYTDVTAPIAGVVGRAMKMEGGLADSSGNSLLTTMAQLDPVYVNFGVAEQDHLAMRAELASGKLRMSAGSLTVGLLDNAGNRLPQTGKLDFQDYKVDPVSGNFAMRATVPNADRTLAPGQFVRVMLEGLVRAEAVTLPQRAVLDNPEGKYVYVATKNEQGGLVAMPRPVQVGEWVNSAEGKNWVVSGGLKAGDQVVVEGMARIFFPGMPIVPAETAPADAPTAPAPAAGQ